jgi:glycosyltransferase involved in cell wall biosynthesis
VSYRRRLWIVTELYYPELTSTGYYLTAIAEGLADERDVHVLCGQPNYSARGLRAPKVERRREVVIRRCWSTTLDKNVNLYRLLNMVTLGLSIFIAAVPRLSKGDLVLAMTTPAAVGLMTALACRLRRCPYILLVHDSYPEVLSTAGAISPTSWIARGLDWLNRRVYAGSARIIVVGRDMKALIDGKHAEAGPRTTFIPNWAELEQVTPAPRADNALLQRLGLADHFVLLYAGNLGRLNDIETIVACAERLRDDPRYRFLFLGDGAKKEWLARTVRERQLTNVLILEARPRADQTEFLNACDMALVPLIRGMRGVSVPSRLYNFLAAGKPIIALADCGSEVDQVIREENVGWVVPPHDPERLAAVIGEAASDTERLQAMGRRARLAAETKYTLRQAVASYAGLIHSIQPPSRDRA